ncbi:hypothetical protein [Bacteroides oleiciplenus]|uniref:hypothetical protein n=1 Tax=Bacteroides oleiciplenus TaxID=626931 RepID=UPI0026DCC423|nr:hypothetical protein [Bacteroides oleiciplenus]
MNKILDKSFDSEFDKIKNLTWYPWVGKDYKDAHVKVLIIGESQYATTEDGRPDDETAADFKSNKATTREFAYNTITKEVNPAKFYNNLLKTFVPDENIEIFWNKVSFYHFFQDPDEAVSSNKHLKKECLKAWSLWREIIEILQPDICVFCGVGLGKYYEQWNETIGKEFNWQDIQTDFCKGNHQPPIFGRFDITSIKMANLLFINHPSSRGYSPDRWHDFLKQQFPEVMKWLNRE